MKMFGKVSVEPAVSIFSHYFVWFIVVAVEYIENGAG
jgi:hypothetical protein